MNKLNILHVSYSLGESSAATRLAKSLDDKVNNYFLCGRISRDNFIKKKQLIKLISFLGSLFTRLIDRALFRLLNYPNGELFSYGIISLPQRFFTWLVVKLYKIDVLHYHWGGLGFFPLSSIPNIKKLKIVITLHDYHAIAGGCHIPMGLEINNCSNFLKRKKIGSKLINKNFSKNRSIIEKKNITIISPSSFVQTKINRFFNSKIIPNCYGDEYYMDQAEFSLVKDSFDNEKEESPSMLVVGLKKSKENNKGFDTFEKTLKDLDIKLKIVGAGCSKSDLINLDKGMIDSANMRKLYRSADLCVVFSRYETFSQVCLESIMCGTPVIAFGSNGPGDILQKSRLGLELEKYSNMDFKILIEKNLTLKKNDYISYEELSSFREFFSPKKISSQYLEVYKK